MRLFHTKKHESCDESGAQGLCVYICVCMFSSWPFVPLVKSFLTFFCILKLRYYSSMVPPDLTHRALLLHGRFTIIAWQQSKSGTVFVHSYTCGHSTYLTVTVEDTFFSKQVFIWCVCLQPMGSFQVHLVQS